MNEGSDTTRTVETDGITVQKTVEDDGRVTLDIGSDRDGAATVQVTDPALDSASDEVQFLTDDGDWNTEDEPRFERAFGPGERRTVRYRIPEAGPDALATEPRVSVLTDPDLAGIADRDRSDALRAFVGGDRESLAPTGDSTGVAAEAVSDSNRAEQTDETPPAKTPSAESGDGSSDIARALLAELRNDRVSEETRAALREELGNEAKRSQDVRIKHLQREMSDLAAYTETIESFIDRHGTPTSVVADVRSELSTLEDRTDDAESALMDLENATERIDDLDTDIESIQSAQSELEDELDELRTSQSDLESRLGGFETELSDVHDRLEALELFEERISGVFRDVQPDDHEE